METTSARPKRKMRSMILFLFAWCTLGASLDDLRAAFQNPPDDARMMVRWWWFGPSVQQPELDREMRAMKDAGIGGFEVQPVYPLSVDGNYPYLSPEFLDALKFAAEKANELGLRMDLTLGSGWPFGGPHIPITQAAGKLRIDAARPALQEGDAPIADLNELWFTSSRTRQMVKRAAMGAEGFVLDHYDRAAIETHLKFVGEPLMTALAAHPPYAVFSDSLEVYVSDWTPRFLDEFERRRGYDLRPHLAELADTSEKSAAIRHDWGRTLTELANESYLTPIREWAARHGTKFRSQTYGVPPVNLSSNALVDLAEGEGWQWRQFSNTRWASSANHLYKRAVTSSETWTWLHSPVFRATPLDLKAEADLHFLEGVNQIIGHGWPYSPPEAGEPGWHFYAAAALNPHNPWWIVMPDVAKYLQRVSFLLRQGEPVADVAVYLPTDDAYARFTPGHVSVSQLMNDLIGPRVIPQILDQATTSISSMTRRSRNAASRMAS
jgi:alpha-L-rhamnosidase